MDPILNYRLPMSVIRISGSRIDRHDRILDQTRTERQASTELVVGADPGGPWAIELDAGSLRDTQASFKLLPDGRLTSASMSITGQGGAVLSAVIGVASSVAGAIIPIPGLRARIGLRAADDESRVDAAYRAEQPDAAEARQQALQDMEQLSTTYRAAVAEVAAADSDEARVAALRRARQVASGLAMATDAVTRSQSLFAAWRATTITAREVSRTCEITLDEIRLCDASVGEDGLVTFPGPAGSDEHSAKVDGAQAKVREAWEQLGCLVLVGGDSSDRERAPRIAADNSKMVVRYRVPRRVDLQFYKADTAAEELKARLDAVRPTWIVDGASRTEALKISAGLFGKASGGVTFTEEGIYGGLEFGRTSEGAAIATAVAGVPGQIASGLETTGKVFDQVETLRSKGAQQALARLKGQVESKQQELTLAGLLATEADHAELVRLTQQADLLEQRAALGLVAAPPDPASSEIAQLRQQVELLRLRQQLARLED